MGHRCRLKNNIDGSALAFVIIAMAVVFILVTATIMIGTNEQKQALYQTSEIKAYYLARAGAESMVKELQRMSVSELNANFGTIGKTAYASNNQSDSSSSILNSTGTVSVTVTMPRAGEIYIESNSQYFDAMDTVGIWLYLDEISTSDSDYAAYAKYNVSSKADGTVDVGVQTIDGLVAAGGEVVGGDNVVAAGGAYLNGETSSLEILDFDTTSFTKNSFGPDINLTDHDNTNYTISASSDITGTYTKNNKVLTINTNNGAYKRLEDMDNKQFKMLESSSGEYPSSGDLWTVLYFHGDIQFKNGTIKIVGDENHNLMLIVEDEMTISGTVLEIDPDVYVKCYVLDHDDEDDDIVLEGTDFVLSSELLTLDLDGDGIDIEYDLNEQTDREIISDYYNLPEKMEFILYGPTSMDISNNGSTFIKIYAEEGLVSLKNGNSEIYGSIYANQVLLSGQASIIYKETVSEEFVVGTEQIIDVDHWGED